MTDDDTMALVEQAKAGDTAALTTLIERNQGAIHRFGLSMCRNGDDADDVMQDTLMAMARGIVDFRGDSSLSTWLFTIARRACLKRRRRRRHQPAPGSITSDDAVLDAVKDPASTPEAQVARHELDAAVKHAIADLDVGLREVIVLRDVEGLSADEVTQVLGLSLSATKSRLHRARQQVRAAVAPLLDPHVDDATPSTCPDIVRTFSRHLEGELTPGVCQQMEAHLATCPHCQKTCDSLKATLSACRATAVATPVPKALQAQIRAAVEAAAATWPVTARAAAGSGPPDPA